MILLDANNIPANKSPQEQVYDNWDITSEYKLLPIPDCMLRGMLDALAKEEHGKGVNLIAQK